MGIREDVLALADELDGVSVKENCDACLASGTELCRGDLECVESAHKACAKRLREIVEHDAGEVTTMSAYDLLPEEDREALAWVCEYGGLDLVKAFVHQGAVEHGFLLKIVEMLGTSIYDGSDNVDDLLAKISERLMPEGMEWLIESWPRFDDNEPLRWDDEYANGNGGVSPLRHVSLYADGRAMLGKGKTKVVLAPGERVKRPPVLVADGEPLEAGQTVWDVESGIEYEVVCIHTDEDTPVRVMRTDGSHLAKAAKPSTLTHQRPDTWERLEHDAEKTVCEYFGANYDCANCPLESARCAEEVKKDIIRRAKKLAERGA